MDKEAAFGYALQAQHCVVATESWQGKRTGIFAFKMNISFFLDNQLPTIYFRQHKMELFYINDMGKQALTGIACS